MDKMGVRLFTVLAALVFVLSCTEGDEMNECQDYPCWPSFCEGDPTCGPFWPLRIETWTLSPEGIQNDLAGVKVFAFPNEGAPSPLCTTPCDLNMVEEGMHGFTFEFAGWRAGADPLGVEVTEEGVVRAVFFPFASDVPPDIVERSGFTVRLRMNRE